MPNALGIALVPLLGLLFGSFLNVCITRLPLHESITLPASHCRNCGAAIRWRHNVPVLSYILLRGRCADCGTRFGWRYPAVELGLALLWLECALRWGLTPTALHAMVLCFLTLGLLVTDIETMLLPDRMTLIGIALGIALSYARSAALLKDSLEGAALGFAIPWIIAMLYRLVRKREGMGLGDAKLLAMIGAFLGVHGMLLVFAVGVIAAAIAGLIVLARTRSAGMQAALPLGAFLAGAAIAVLFFRNTLARPFEAGFRLH